MKRAERRQAICRVKNKVKRRIRDTWYHPTFGEHKKLEEDPKFVGKIANTPHCCSELCCGNPRHHFKGKDRLTLQERRLAPVEE